MMLNVCITEEHAAALRDLKEAHDFRALCLNDKENASATGAMRDAHEWLVRAVCDVVATMPELPRQD